MEQVLRRLESECHGLYGPRLASVCVFGSVARGTATPASDIDLMIVAEDLPRGRMARVREFAAVSARLGQEVERLRTAGLPCDFSPVFKTPEEARRLGPLFLDMTIDRILLFDRDGFLEELLSDFSKRLDQKGARRMRHGDSEYWLLAPELKPGETWEI